MPKNPFRHKAKTVKDLQFWVDETFKEAESEGDTPVGVFVVVFTKNEGVVKAVYKRSFAMDKTILGPTNGDIVKALDDESFAIRYRIREQASKAVRKK